MESFQISKDLIEDDKSKISVFGYMKFFKKGRIAVNKRMVGLYFTIFIILSGFSTLIFLIDRILEQEMKIITCIFLSVSTLILFSQLFYVSFSNPGFLKPDTRDLENDNKIKSLIATIGDQNIFLKYCKTCKIVKDIRVFHCKYCNLCVVRHDHHCPWLSICIGIQNHKRFLFLIIFSIFHCCLKLAIVFIISTKFTDSPTDNKLASSFKNLNYTVTLFLMSMISIFLILLFIIIFFQFKFISNNETTSENIRRPAKVANPFDKGCKKNFKDFYNNIGAYKYLVSYNENSKGYLSSIMSITEYYSFVERRSSKSSSTSVSDSSKNLDFIGTFDTSKSDDKLTEEK